MYYEYVTYKTTTHTSLDTITEDTKFVEVADNKFEGVIATDLTPETAYDVFYVLEDEFGSRTEVKGPVTITKNSEGVQQYSKVEDVELSDLTKVALDDLQVSWKGATGKAPVKPSYGTYIVTLYNGETPVYSKEITFSPFTFNDARVKTIMSKPGTYKVSIVVKGDDTHTASEPAYSEAQEIKALNAVTNFKFDIDQNDSNVILKWDTDYDVTQDIAGYGLSIVTIDEEGKETDVSGYQVASPKDLTSSNSTLMTDMDNKAHKFTSAQAGVIYKATMVVKAKAGQSAIVNSEEAVTKEFFYINVNGINVSATKPETATLEFTNGPIVVAGQEATYKVEIYEVDDLGGHTNYNKVNTKSVTLTKNENNKYFADIDGLDSSKKYVFRVIANVGDIEGISGFTSPELGILKGMPELSNLTVAKESGAGKIYKKSATVLSINGEDYTIAQYPGTLAKMAELIDNTNGLKENDKIVSFDGTTLRVDFADSEDVRNLTGKLAGLTLEVVADKHKLTLTTTDTEKVVIEARENPGLVDISAVKAKEIVLKDGANVTTTKEDGSQPVVIASGATVSIKGMKITSSSEDTTIALNSSDTIDVTPNAGSNNLTFEATGTDADSDNLVINFNRTAGASESKQQGTITIIPTKLNVTVKSNVLVESNIIANLTDSYLDVKSVELTGTKTVSVATSKDSGKAKVKGRFAGTLPQTNPGKANPTFTKLPLKEYKDLNTLNTESDKASNVDESNFEAVKEFLAGFGLNALETAKVTINNTTNVTLTFAANTPATSVTGLK